MTFLTHCTTLSFMNTVNLRNSSDFPDYNPSHVLDSSRTQQLIKSDQWTRGEFIAQWENTTEEELIMLWLWHNGEIREIYRLSPQTLSRTSLLEGMGIAVVSERRGLCLFSKVVTRQSLDSNLQRFT